MKKLILTSLLVTIISFFSFGQNKVGCWKFDDATNFLKADIGKTLSLVGTGIHKADGLDAANGAVTVDVGTHFIVDHGIVPNAGEGFVNNYSLVIDFKIPSVGSWYNFFQTDQSNTSDGDCFINKTGNIGTSVTGYSASAVSADKWYRLVVSVKLGTSYRYYIDGNLINDGVSQSIDGRFSLDKTLLLFADDDGEDGTLTIAEVSLYDGALDDAAVAALGVAGHTTGVSSVMATNENVRIVNPIRDNISIIVPDNQTIQAVTLYDVCGHTVLQSTSGDTKLDVTGIAKGTYIALVKIGGKNYTLKCVKE